MKGTNGMMIGTVAREAGVNLDTIRYYERRGLLPEPPRRPSGYRVFDDDTVRRVRFIKRAQELGFTLNEIRDLMDLRLTPEASCCDVRDKAAAKIASIAAKIQQLRSMRAALKGLMAACSGRGSVEECPILASLADEP